MKFSGTVGNGPRNKRLNFGGDPDHESAYRSCLVRGICNVSGLLVYY